MARTSPHVRLEVKRLLRLGCCLLAVAGIACEAARASDPRKATTSREARDETTRSVPLEQIAETERGGVAYVLKNASMYRRLPTQVIDCDPTLFQFLMRNPEVLVHIWDALGISAVQLDRVDDNTFRAADGEGTRAMLRVVYSSHDKHIVYAEGTYQGPLFPQPVNAKCVVVLRSGSIKETNGRYYVTCRLDTFIRIERIGVELIAKTFQPMIGRAADHNFAETLAFTASLSRTAEVNPHGVERLAQRLTKIDPERREQFVQVSHELARRASQEAEARSVNYQRVGK